MIYTFNCIYVILYIKPLHFIPSFLYARNYFLLKIVINVQKLFRINLFFYNLYIFSFYYLSFLRNIDNFLGNVWISQAIETKQEEKLIVKKDCKNRLQKHNLYLQINPKNIGHRKAYRMSTLF